MEDIKILSELFINKYGSSPDSVVKLPGAGSGRGYYRLVSGAGQCIGVAGENIRDCRSFVNLSKAFHKDGIPVPEVYEVSENGLYYLQEDLGDISLFDCINASGAGRKEDAIVENDYKAEQRKDTERLIASALRELARMQTIPGEKWERFAEYSPFSRRQIFWDLNYFKYEFLKPSGLDFDEEKLENDFEKMADKLIESGEAFRGFMYRDFQSRNVMVKSGECRFIDYQGGRIGPSIYDAVSFLWQAKAGFSDEFRKKMLAEYAQEYGRIRNLPADRVLESVPLFALFRTLQVLGAYGLRGLIEKKAHFIESIPMGMKNLMALVEEGATDSYPELKRIALELSKDRRFEYKEKKDYLTLQVFSFSYKKGYPSDYSGNGGGFMFDCRGMHNPGRYEQYKPLTGLDLPVIEFLKEKKEADVFAEKGFELIRPTVERYIKRGFTSLQVGFGCTGGRHRSVYCAEAVAGMFAKAYPEVKVEVIHREQNIKKTYNDRK